MTLLLVVVFLIAAAIGWAVGRGSQPEIKAKSASVERPGALDSAALSIGDLENRAAPPIESQAGWEGGALASPDPRSMPEPLPPVDVLPVSEIIEALDARAKAGDADAACRIAAELLRCQGVQNLITGEPASRVMAANLARMRLNPEELERLTREYADALNYNERVKANCRDVDPAQDQQLWRHLRVAAEDGRILAGSSLASGIGVSAGNLVADPELLAYYRSHGWRLFQRGFEAGDPRTVQAWSRSLTWGATTEPLGVLLPAEWRDPALALALLRRVENAMRPRPTPAGAPSAPPEPSAIAARADELFDRFFADSPYLKQAAEQARESEVQTPAAHRFHLPDRICK